MKKKMLLIPKLRFPDYINQKEWDTKSMDTIFNIRNGYTPSKANPRFWDNGNIPWFRMEDIRLNGHILSDSIQHVTPEAIKGTGLFPAYSIIVATTATIGEHALIIVDSLANQRFTFLTKRKSFEKVIDMLYFHYYMFIVDDWCKKNTNCGGLLSVNMSAFKHLMIPYPIKLSEQRKIAECLSTIDSYISSINEKVEQLKAHKKSLLQKLFPQRGQTVPEYRFSEFKELGMWTEKTLGDIGDVCMCKRIMKNETNINYSIPFYKIGTFGKKADTYITEERFNEYKAKYSYPQKGDILFSAAGTIGRYVEFDGEPAYFQDSNIVWIANDETLVCNKFLKYLYSKVQWNIDDGGVVKRLYNDSIKKTSIHIPSMSEQRKIAGCLSSIDEAITLYSEKVSLIEQHKKGLMQQLFPTPK